MNRSFNQYADHVVKMNQASHTWIRCRIALKQRFNDLIFHYADLHTDRVVSFSKLHMTDSAAFLFICPGTKSNLLSVAPGSDHLRGWFSFVDVGRLLPARVKHYFIIVIPFFMCRHFVCQKIHKQCAKFRCNSSWNIDFVTSCCRVSKRQHHSFIISLPFPFHAIFCIIFAHLYRISIIVRVALLLFPHPSGSDSEDSCCSGGGVVGGVCIRLPSRRAILIMTIQNGEFDTMRWISLSSYLRAKFCIVINTYHLNASSFLC